VSKFETSVKAQVYIYIVLQLIVALLTSH